ncbi:MAG: hypothetical protein AAGJ46_00320 [Planctomycetota bacterium]
MSARKLPSLRKPEPVDETPAGEGASEPAEVPTAAPPPTGGYRFDLRMIFLLMFIACVAAAGWGGMTRKVDHEYYVIFATAAPVAVLAVVGLLHHIAKMRRRK